MYLLRYTPQAMRDMDSVWEDVYDASQSCDIADKYIKDFAEMIVGKKRFPKSGTPLRYKGLFTGFYYVTFKKYMAFYRIEDNYIEVARVLYARSDYMQILFPLRKGICW